MAKAWGATLNLLPHVRTQYVKGKIKGKSFKNEKYRDYIEDLIYMELFLSGKALGMWSGHRMAELKDRYKKDYLAIKTELNPNWRKEEAERRKKEREKELKKEKKRQQEERKQLKKYQKEWLKLGGKP